jgi:putative membrane protein
MKFPDTFRTKVVVFAGAALLGSGAALAQAPGSMQQAPTAPGGAQTQQGMNPMNQSPDMNGMPANGQTTGMDRMFVENALKGGMAEVQLGQLALQKSSNDDVKQFAQRMIDDHTKLGDQMKPIAQQIGVKIPDAPSKKDQATLAKLRALNGDAFDKAYVKDMVKDHKADLDDFKMEAQNGSNPQVKDAASQGSQIISQHLQMIEQISHKEASMASNGTSNGGTK